MMNLKPEMKFMGDLALLNGISIIIEEGREKEWQREGNSLPLPMALLKAFENLCHLRWLWFLSDADRALMVKMYESVKALSEDIHRKDMKNHTSHIKECVEALEQVCINRNKVKKEV